MLSSGLGKYVAPTALGAGYAIAKMFSLRVLDTELAIAQISPTSSLQECYLVLPYAL